MLNTWQNPFIRSLQTYARPLFALAMAASLQMPAWSAGIGEAVIVRINTASGPQERIGIVMGQSGGMLKVRIYNRSASGAVTTNDVNAYPSQVRPIDTKSANQILSGQPPKARSTAATPYRPTTNPNTVKPNPAKQTSSVQGGSSLAGTFQQIIRGQLVIGSRPKQATFEKFSVGAPHKYRFNNLAGSSPDGPFGRMGTTVYPVTTTYVVKESFLDADQFVRKTRYYSCFVSSNNQWICNMKAGGGGDQFWTVSQ